MTLLGRFGLVLLLFGLGLGWAARRRWGPLRGIRPWLVVLAVPPVHALAVLARGVAVGVAPATLSAFAAGTLALLVLAVAFAVWLLRTTPRWSALIPPAHALGQGAAVAALGEPFAALGAAPPGLGSALVLAVTLVAAGAWLVWLPGRRRAGDGAGGGQRERSGRLQT